MFSLSCRPCGASLLDRPFVFDRRDVAGVAVEDDGLQHATHDLAAAGLGQHADEVELADDGDGAQLAADRVEQRLPQLG